MADFKVITVDGVSYTVKDEAARAAAQQANETANAAKSTAEQANTTAGQANTTAQAAQQTANQANTAAGQAQQKANQNETDITNLAGDSLTVSYVSESESIVFTKGINLE